MNPRLKIISFAAFALAGSASASATEIRCDIGQSDVAFGKDQIRSLTIVHENGKSPILKTGDNLNMEGYAIVRNGGDYVYRFTDLKTLGLREGQKDWLDQAVILYNPTDPSKSKVNFRRDERDHWDSVIHQSWRIGRLESRLLVNCMFN